MSDNAIDSDTDPEQDLDEQPLQPTRCPDCGGEPAPEVTHRLSATGYLHDDQTRICEDCGHQWDCGVPIGEFDRPELAESLQCGCGGWRLVHRAAITGGGNITLHLKCPKCYSFVTEKRNVDSSGVALVGYPQTSGQTEGCTPYGWEDDADADADADADD